MRRERSRKEARLHHGLVTLAEVIKSAEVLGGDHYYGALGIKLRRIFSDLLDLPDGEIDGDAAIAIALETRRAQPAVTESAHDRFERLATDFYRETRVTAPGKDIAPAEGDNGICYETRMRLWREWLAAREAGREP